MKRLCRIKPNRFCFMGPSGSMHKLTFIYQRFVTIFFLICAAGVLISSPGHGDNSVAEEIISLDVTERPLGQVLDEIATAAGYRIIFDERWDDFLISASVKNEPLYKGLKRVLRNLNNAVIYGSDRTIKIIIFDEVQASRIPASHSLVGSAPEEHSHRLRSQPSRPFPLPTPRDTSEPSTDEEESRLPNETATEIEEQKEIESGGSAEEVTEDPAPEQNEDSSGEDAESPRKTAAAGD